MIPEAIARNYVMRQIMNLGKSFRETLEDIDIYLLESVFKNRKRWVILRKFKIFLMKLRLMKKAHNFIWENLFCKLFQVAFKGIGKLYNIKKVKVNIIIAHLLKRFMNADLIVSLAVRLIKRRFGLRHVIRYINRGLRNVSKYYHGYKLCFVGRYKRRGRATYIWQSERTLSLSNVDSYIDFASKECVTKWGMGGIKCWINWNHERM